MKLLAPCLLLTVVAGATAAESWSSFQNGGVVSYPSAWPVLLGDIQWQVELAGYGQSTPVVRDNRVYITTVAGANKDNCHVTAYHLANGKQLWQHTVANATPAENSNYISRAAPSPVVDDDGVVCFFEGGNVVSLTSDGKLRWERNLVNDYGDVKARHGLSSSLEQNADSVFVWIERSESPYLVSLNKQNGETKWKSEGLGATSWASPRLVPVDGGQHLVLSAIGSLAGYDPSSGEQLWLFDGISGNSTPTPMPMGDGRFLIGATTGRGESGGGRAAESNGVIKISKGKDGNWSADYLWQAKRATSSFGSPILHNGMALFVNREGVLYGLDADSGEEVFAKRLKGSSWATPVGIGDRVFFFGRDGKVDCVSDLRDSRTVSTWDKLSLPPKPEKQASSESRERRGPSSMFSGPVMYAASWCGDRVLLRRGDRLFSVEVKESHEDDGP